MRSIIIFLPAIVCALPTTGWASDNPLENCRSSLMLDTLKINQYEHKDWRLAELVTKDNWEDAKKSADASGYIYGFPAHGSYEDYSNNVQSEVHRHNESLNDEQVSELALTQVGTNSLEAYKYCLETTLFMQEGLYAVITGAANDNIAITVHWREHNHLPTKITWDPTSIGGKVIDGVVPDGEKTILVPRPKTETLLVGNANGMPVGPFKLEPTMPAAPPKNYSQDKWDEWDETTEDSLADVEKKIDDRVNLSRPHPDGLRGILKDGGRFYFYVRQDYDGPQYHLKSYEVLRNPEGKPGYWGLCLNEGVSSGALIPISMNQGGPDPAHSSQQVWLFEVEGLAIPKSCDPRSFK